MSKYNKLWKQQKEKNKQQEISSSYSDGGNSALKVIGWIIKILGLLFLLIISIYLGLLLMLLGLLFFLVGKIV
jgi:hypothetical protein